MKSLARIVLGVLGITICIITIHFASTVSLQGPNIIDIGLGLLLGVALIVVASGILSKYLFTLIILVGFPVLGWGIGTQLLGKAFGGIIGLIGGGFFSYQFFKKGGVRKVLSPPKKSAKQKAYTDTDNHKK